MSACLPVCAGPKATFCLHEVKMPLEQGRRYWGQFQGHGVRFWFKSCVTLDWLPFLYPDSVSSPSR